MKKIFYLALLCGSLYAAEIATPASAGKNHLHHACRTGNLSLVRALLDNNFSINEQDIFSRTPLYYALRGEYDAYQSGSPRSSAISLLLLEKGHSLSYCDPIYTPLMYASQFGLHNVTQKLLALGAKVNYIDQKSGCTALMLAAQQNKVAIAKLLLLYGADACIGDPTKSALKLAIEWRDKDLPELLKVLEETQPNARLTLGENPLIFLARREREPLRLSKLKHCKRL